MQIATCWLYLNKAKNDVPLRGVTPAELQLLVNERQDLVGTFPIHDLKIVGTIRRASRDEKHRLAMKYGRPPGEKDPKKTRIEAMYPGENGELPENFADLGATTVEQASVELLGKPVPHPDDLPEEKVEEIIEQQEAA